MTTIIQVKEAIAALKDRTGSSVVAISKWLESEKKVSSLAWVWADFGSDPFKKKRMISHEK